MSVQFPGKAYNSGEDLGPPIQELLRAVNVLEGVRRDTDGKEVQEESTLLGTPPSLQLITAGATTLTKVWAVLLGLAGSAAGVFSAIQAAAAEEPVLVASAAFLGAAALLGAALVVRADVSARAHAAAAEYAARASIVTAFVANCYVGRPAPERTRYWLRESDGNGRVSSEWKPVERMEQDTAGLVAVLAGQRGRVPAARIAEWQTRP